MPTPLWRALPRVLVVALVALALARSAVPPPTVTADEPFHVFIPLVSQNGSQIISPEPDTGRIGMPWEGYDRTEARPGQMLVKWRDGVDIETIARINGFYNVRSIGHVQGLGVQILQAPPDLSADTLDSYNRLPEVEYAEPNFIAYAMPGLPVGPRLTEAQLKPQSASVNDPQANQQYSLSKMQVYNAWDVSRGDGVIIAILDSGADFTHPDLKDKFVSQGKDFINGDNNASDDQGHGTHVSGIAAGATNNGIGIAGVGYNARILPVKVLSAAGSGDYGSISSGITWAADNGAKIINMSLGGAAGSSTLEAAVNYAWNKGVVVVCAAGNSSTSQPAYPAAYANCISVVATDESDRRGSFSNYGSTVDVSAPGVSILSTVRGGGYQAWSGTSMASPNAAGVAALVAAANPGWTNAQIRAQLESTVDVIGSAFDFGKGRLNATRAVGNSGAPTPTPGGPTATPTPAPATATPLPTAPPNDFELQVIQLINAERLRQGLSALQVHSSLMDAADFHNRWMLDNNCFDHVCPNEPDPMQRMRNAGYPLLSGGENIGQGYQTAQNMFDGWMNSAGHRANILGNWVDIGCGFLQGPSGSYLQRYWTCNFARPSGVAPTPTATQTPNPTPPPGVTATHTPTRTPTGAPTGGPPSQTEWARRTLVEINRIRAEQGLAPGVNHDTLARIAQTYSQLMYDTSCWSHYCDGTPWDRMRLGGYDAEAYSEVIARAFPSPEDTVVGWMNSPAHRDIIMSSQPGFQMEVGCGWDRELFYATCDVGYRRLSGTPTPTALPTLTPTATRTPTATAMPTALPTLTPTATRTPTASATPGLPPPPGTPTWTPTASATAGSPLPTVTPGQPGGVEITLTPPSNVVGWVSNSGGRSWGDSKMYVGVYYNQVYIGGIQFPLLDIPRNATLLSAQLELTGQATDFLSPALPGEWIVRWLDRSFNNRFANTTFTDLNAATVLDTLAPVMGPTDFARNRKNILPFNVEQVRTLQDQRALADFISFRIEGPRSGALAQVMTWDTGKGTASLGAPPVLRVRYTTDNLPPPPATPTEMPTLTSTPTWTPTVTHTTTATPIPPTATSTPTNTPLPPTATWTATATPVPPTPTATATPVPPTATATATNTPIPPTATPTATKTPLPPTATDTPTNTPVPPTATPTSTPTPLPPTPTGTFMPTATDTPTHTPVPPTATDTPTNTPVPPTATDTPTNTPVPPTATDTPTNTPVPPTATDTPTNTPVPPTATPSPTAKPVLKMAELTPAANYVGWVITVDTDTNHLGDDDVFAGKWGSYVYYGLMQFSVASLPADASIQSAELILSTQSREWVDGGAWSVKMLGSDVDADFARITFPQADAAAVLGLVGDPIPAASLPPIGRAVVLTLSAERVADLQARLASTGRVSLRVDGPPADGSTYSLHSFDSGYGFGGLGPDFRPTLRLRFISAQSEP